MTLQARWVAMTCLEVSSCMQLRSSCLREWGSEMCRWWMNMKASSQPGLSLAPGNSLLSLKIFQTEAFTISVKHLDPLVSAGHLQINGTGDFGSVVMSLHGVMSARTVWVAGFITHPVLSHVYDFVCCPCETVSGLLIYLTVKSGRQGDWTGERLLCSRLWDVLKPLNKWAPQNWPVLMCNINRKLM